MAACGSTTGVQRVEELGAAVLPIHTATGLRMGCSCFAASLIVTVPIMPGEEGTPTRFA